MPSEARSEPRYERVLAFTAWLVATACVATSLCTIAACHLRWPAFDWYQQGAPLLELPFPQDVLALANGHRPVVPNLVRVLDQAWFGRGQVLVTLVAVLLALVALAVVVRAAWRDAALGSGQRAAVVLAAALAVFWLANARMLVHGSEMLHVQFTLIGLLLGASCLVRARTHPAGVAWGVAAGACATIATFSFGPGIVAFPALVVAALATGVPSRALAGIGVVFVVVLAIYVYALPGAEGVRNQIVLDPATNVLQASQWLASPVFTAWTGLADPQSEAWRVDAVAAQLGGATLRSSATALQGVIPAHGGWWSSSAVIGIAFVVAAALGCVRVLRHRRAASALDVYGVALVAFGGASALLVAIARRTLFELHPGQIYADRYLPWPCLFLLGLSILLVKVLPRRAGAAGAAAMLLAALVAYPMHIVAAGWSEAVYDGVERSALALWLGVWDERVMPNAGDSTRESVLHTAALLRARDPRYYGDPLPTAPVPGPYGTATTRAVAMQVDARFDDAPTGRTVVAFSGALATGTRRDVALAVLDDSGRAVGVASARLATSQWKALVWEQPGGVRFAGYAFVPQPCGALRLVQLTPGGASEVGTLDACAG